MKLKKKIEAVEEAVEETMDEATIEEAEVVDVENEEDVQEGVALDYPEQLNEDEKEALAKVAPEETKEAVSVAKMNNVLDLVTDEFNLSGKRYTVQQYKDGGSKVTLAMSNEEYDVTITVKDVYSKVPCL